MPLFQHKKRIKFPKQEIDPIEETAMIRNRLRFLIKKEQGIDKKTTEHKETLNSEVSFLDNQLISIRKDLQNIKSGIQHVKNNFEYAVKELGIHAKIEDLNHLRRMLQEYDPGDFISYKEFRRMAEEKVNLFRI